ncbi:MAG: GDP-mannose 4,6-dehydratase [Planctomycetes bacterium]|jgi:UDP-glucose 4-epimerase|nr:GDP-mannose 4,6-dehydratase [Planctomycetota bacterium]
MDEFRPFYEGRRALVTGGLGFLGSNLAVALAGLGARVTVLDALLPLYGGNRFNLEPAKDRVETVIADVRDAGAVRAAVRGADAVFHIAAQTSHVDSMTDPFTDIDMNCRGTIVLLEAVRAEAPGALVVYAGTRGQYGAVERPPATEDTPFRPTDVYSADKAAGEAYAFVYRRSFGLRACSLRISNAYGPRHQMKHARYGILNWFVRLALEGKTIKVFGDGAQLRDYHYVDDVTRAFLLAGSRPEAEGRIFNLGGPVPVRFVDMVREVIRAAGSGSFESVPWPADRKAIEVGDFAADWSSIRRTLGWEPKVGLAEGLARTVAYYREHRARYWTD